MDARTLVDVVLVVVGVELIVAIVVGRRARLPGVRALIPNLAAGLFLVLALRSAVRDDGTIAIATFLALGGVAHLLDLRRRMVRPRR